MRLQKRGYMHAIRTRVYILRRSSGLIVCDTERSFHGTLNRDETAFPSAVSPSRQPRNAFDRLLGTPDAPRTLLRLSPSRFPRDIEPYIYIYIYTRQGYKN